MHPVPDDDFRLRFPVAKDRTLRRVAIIQLSIYIICFSSIGVFWIGGAIGFYIADGGRQYTNNIGIIVAVVAAVFFALSFPAAWIMSIIEARIHIRRYGWRAVSDPVEAQRIAMREAMYDVATGSAQAMPGHADDRPIVVPAQRLRPVLARLELTAERAKTQGRHKN